MLKKIIFAFSFVALIFACSSDDSSSSSNGDSFDRTAMLSNWADNIIIPAFQDLDTKLEVLKTNTDAFTAAPNQVNLEATRASWLSAYRIWQSVEMFNIGKAEEIQYGFQMNVYPTNIEDIENNISGESYDLANVNNQDAVGFPAVEYMLYGLEANDALILNKYSDAKYKTYLTDLVDRMVSITELVLNDWSTSYRSSFISQSANTATSSVNKLTNDFIFYYEKGLRANKIGIPAGVFSGSSPFSDKVEGYYSKMYSKELSLIALQAVQDFFIGKSYNSAATDSGFATYLNALDRADLVATIDNKLNNAYEKLQTLDDDLSNQVSSDNVKMTEAYDVLQLAVVSLKVDMIQAMNINIDYVDADGD
jgi:predicted lipoprotein